MFDTLYVSWKQYFVVGGAALLISCGSVPAVPSSVQAPPVAEIAQPARATATPISASVAAAVPAADSSHGTQNPVTAQQRQHAADRAIADATQRLNVTAADIEVLGVQQRFKPTDVSDSPGVADGWIVRLGVNGKVYQYLVQPDGTTQLQTKPTVSR